MITGTAPDRLTFTRVAGSPARASAPIDPVTSTSTTLVDQSHRVVEGALETLTTVPSRADRPHEPSKLDEATTKVQVRDALVKMGFTPAEARAAVEAAAPHVGTRELEALLRAALKRCPKPVGSRVYEPC